MATAPKIDPEAPVANLNLKEDLKADYPAILRWLIDGYREWPRGSIDSYFSDHLIGFLPARSAAV